MRAWRKAHPIHAQYLRLKAKAKQRKIEFTLTLDEFTKFALKTEYATRTGNTPGSLSVDRIDNLKGYVPGNIRALTREENVEKQMRQDAHRYGAGMAWALGARL